jgi:putative transposase
MDKGALGIQYYGYLIVHLYHGSRTHLALAKDAPEGRPIMTEGKIVAIPQVGGLHHRYERRAA